MAHTFDPVIQSYFRRNTPPSVNKGVRYAIAQGPSQVATLDTIKEAVEFNFGTLEKACEMAGFYQSQLISFPELFLSGYEFGETDKSNIPVETVKKTAEYIRDNGYLEELGPISKIAKYRNIAIICPLPYAGSDPKGNDGIYDAAVIFDADGKKLGMQFKNHLWGIDERRWFRIPEYGGTDNPFRTFEVNGIPIGVAICYDAEFPEVARSLALNGALIAAMPTAAPNSKLPGQSEPYPDISEHYIPANALQNQNFCSYGNRASWEFKVENGKSENVLEYSGNSIICSPYGKPLVKAFGNQDTLLIADCIICDFPSTQPPDTDYLINRRPEIYGIVTSMEADFPSGKKYRYPAEPKQHQDPDRPDTNKNSCS
ncbi:nitrilase-related carbon-nitrogen hydrolase [Burkholderia sp. TSV86]|uniref:nitrilase-related carbon-nitrogen hydrolase n=1 Tax=Burkholderia sp. TSV86 TaxID=1385594 RepID=UPI0009E682EE|nr:nitrilase-related carbon-nitrogen hydrolase [Burkholderia sp. TSV86]